MNGSWCQDRQNPPMIVVSREREREREMHICFLSSLISIV